MNMTQQQMAEVFNEWARRYAENPEEFGEVLDADGKPVTDYGENCAAYFQKIASEMYAKGQIECCGNPEQCWEPCGQLGKSEEHAVAVPGPEGQ